MIDEKALLAAAGAVRDARVGGITPASEGTAYDMRLARAAILAYESAKQKGEAEGWRPIESAPHGEDVLLGWWTQDGMGGSDWSTEIGPASHGWRRGSISNMSRHSHATHWRPLPEPPTMLSAGGEG